MDHLYYNPSIRILELCVRNIKFIDDPNKLISLIKANKSFSRSWALGLDYIRNLVEPNSVHLLDKVLAKYNTTRIRAQARKEIMECIINTRVIGLFTGLFTREHQVISNPDIFTLEYRINNRVKYLFY